MKIIVTFVKTNCPNSLRTGIWLIICTQTVLIRIIYRVTNVYVSVCSIVQNGISFIFKVLPSMCNFVSLNFKTSFYPSQRIFVSPWETYLCFIFDDEETRFQPLFSFNFDKKVSVDVGEWIKSMIKLVATTSMLICYLSYRNRI